MQNDLKYGKISELCGINGYFAGKNRQKIAPAATKIFPCGKRNSQIFFRGGGGGRIQLLVRIYSPAKITTKKHRYEF